LYAADRGHSTFGQRAPSPGPRVMSRTVKKVKNQPSHRFVLCLSELTKVLRFSCVQLQRTSRPLLAISQHRPLCLPCFLYLMRSQSSPYATDRVLALFNDKSTSTHYVCCVSFISYRSPPISTEPNGASALVICCEWDNYLVRLKCISQSYGRRERCMNCQTSF
jgi:hypothetical protein